MDYPDYGLNSGHFDHQKGPKRRKIFGSLSLAGSPMFIATEKCVFKPPAEAGEENFGLELGFSDRWIWIIWIMDGVDLDYMDYFSRLQAGEENFDSR